jgi:hypothetical protein
VRESVERREEKGEAKERSQSESESESGGFKVRPPSSSSVATSSSALTVECSSSLSTRLPCWSVSQARSSAAEVGLALAHARAMTHTCTRSCSALVQCAQCLRIVSCCVTVGSASAPSGRYEVLFELTTNCTDFTTVPPAGAMSAAEIVCGLVDSHVSNTSGESYCTSLSCTACAACTACADVSHPTLMLSDCTFVRYGGVRRWQR